MAGSLIGRRIPDVPRIDRPPSIPSLGLKVFFASSRPPGIASFTSAPTSPAASRITCSIICRGTGLTAASPTGSLSPGRVTVPMPSPAVNLIPPSASLRQTAAITRHPSVTSGSSPASLITPHHGNVPGIISRIICRPAGVSTETSAGHLPDNCHSTEAFAAAAAQVPVVTPSLNFFNSIYFPR